MSGAEMFSRIAAVYGEFSPLPSAAVLPGDVEYAAKNGQTDHLTPE